jgi:hypothetical protein
MVILDKVPDLPPVISYTMCYIFKILLVLSLFSLSQASSKNKISKKISGMERKFPASTSTPAFNPKYIPTSDEYRAAWNSATSIYHRNSDLWKVDESNNIIMTRDLTRNCPISFDVFKEASGKLRDLPRAKMNIFATPWVYIPEAERLMNVLEIALVGYVSDERGNPICWTPSKIHNDFMVEGEDSHSEHWVQNAQSRPINGLIGHNEIFQDMGIFIRKDTCARTIIGSRLDGPIPSVCSEYVRNFVPTSITTQKADSVVLPDSDDEREAKTDQDENTNMEDVDFSRYDGLTDEEFSIIFSEQTSSSASQWTQVPSSSSHKGTPIKTPSAASNTPNGKTTTGGSSVATIDSNSKGKKLVTGAGAKVEKKAASGPHKNFKLSSAYPKK